MIRPWDHENCRIQAAASRGGPQAWRWSETLGGGGGGGDAFLISVPLALIMLLFG
jgi:hypothetical protein